MKYNISVYIKAGVREGFQNGTSKYANRRCYGYDVTADGSLVINPDEAKIVRWMFQRYLHGDSLGKIASCLEKQGILSPTGKSKWNREAIDKLLSNEKYVGDVMLQKTFVDNLFEGKQTVNNGELDRVLIQNHHQGIVDRQLFAQVNGSDE